MATKFTYTESDIQQIVEKYSAGVSLDTLATDYNKSVASVRMKLVKLGVYQKAIAVTKSGVTSTAKPSAKAISKSENSALFFSCLAAVGEAPV